MALGADDDSLQGKASINSPAMGGKVYCAARNASGVCMICTNSLGSGKRFDFCMNVFVAVASPQILEGASAMFVGESTRSIHIVKLCWAATCQNVATIWFTTALFADPLTKAFCVPVLSTQRIMEAFWVICAIMRIARSAAHVSSS